MQTVANLATRREDSLATISARAAHVYTAQQASGVSRNNNTDRPQYIAHLHSED